MKNWLRNVALVASRLACIVAGALVFLWLTLGEYRDSSQLLIVTSLIIGGWCGEVGWWWLLRPRLR